MCNRFHAEAVRRARLPLLALLATLAGCAQQDHVVFVTKTALGVDFDAEPAAATIGYDRIEGYLGPRASNGEVPPVLASIQSSGGVFNSDIRQTYATGTAATSVARGLADGTVVAAPTGDPPDIAGDLKLMFFGTSSTAGFKVGFTADVPTSVTFGYKRKEVSVIPLAQIGVDGQNRPKYRYPSVIAAIDTTAEATGASGTALTNAQFFATGLAADHYGRSPQVQRAFRERGGEALAQFTQRETTQRLAAVDVLTCYAGLLPAQRQTVWADAQAKGLLVQEREEGEDAPAADALLQQIKALDAGTEQEKALANTLYATAISQPSGFEPGRETRLAEHKAVVCKGS